MKRTEILSNLVSLVIALAMLGSVVLAVHACNNRYREKAVEQLPIKNEMQLECVGNGRGFDVYTATIDDRGYIIVRQSNAIFVCPK